MNKRQADRLLNVAKALRESPKPKAFTMSCFIRGDRLDQFEGWCNTPGCALGHYASRRDLQRVFTVITERDRDGNPMDYSLRFLHDEEGSEGISFSDNNFLKYFGLDSYRDADELFSSYGCGDASTPKAAAKYIEQFVANKLKAR